MLLRGTCDGLVTHGAHTAHLQPLHQTPAPHKEGREEKGGGRKGETQRKSKVIKMERLDVRSRFSRGFYDPKTGWKVTVGGTVTMVIDGSDNLSVQ